MPRIDLGASVFELTEAHPQIIPILQDLGFKGVVNPITRKTVGRWMTIPGGCKMKRIALETVVERLAAAGFTVTGGTSDE